MYEYYFSLCGIYLQLSSELPLHFIEPVEVFQIESREAFLNQVSKERESDSSVSCIEHYTIRTYEGILPSVGEKMYDCFKFQIYSEGNRMIYQYRVGNTINPYHARLILNPQIQKGVREHELLFPQSYAERIAEQISISSMLGFEPMVMWHGRIPMHAASVMIHDKVILFTGPSGMGKSTQSNLWLDHLHARPVNGDKTILYPNDKEIRAYGSLYAGSSDIIHNISGITGAIVTLKQGEENRIRLLSPAEGFRKIYPRFLIPQWNPSITAYAMELIQRIVTEVPVYELVCRPEEAAAKLTYDTIFGK